MIETLLVVIIVLIVFFGNNILKQVTSIVRATGRNYTLYPVFSEEDIIRQQKEAEKQDELFELSLEYLQKLEIKEKKDIENIDHSDQFKSAMKDMIEKELEKSYESTRLYLMIEANLQVINGKKTIAETHIEDIGKIYVNLSIRMDEVEKRYKKWLTETRKDRQVHKEKLFPFLKKSDSLHGKDK